MSMEITIKQKGFIKKTLPLEVILGEELQYGCLDGLSLRRGEMTDGEFIAYHPEHIARGFSVIWTAEEKNTVELRLLTPSTREELIDFYATVERIAKYWNAKLLVDGNAMTVEQFKAGFEETVEFNRRTLKDFAGKILNGEFGTFMIFAAFFPLEMGKEEAEMFASYPDSFAGWLHEKQNVDACYASPNFYTSEQGIIGRYIFGGDTACIFPTKPYVPFYVTDPNTGKALECDDWGVLLGDAETRNIIGEITYDRFMSRVAESKKTLHYSGHILIAKMSLPEIKELLNEGE